MKIVVGTILKHKNSLDCGIYIKKILTFDPDYVKLSVGWVNLGKYVFKMQGDKEINQPYCLNYNQTLIIYKDEYKNWDLVEI